MKVSTTLVEDYLDGRKGSSLAYRRFLSLGQRMGQAFFNSLSIEDQDRLTGSLYDPFHKNDQDSIYKAMEYLLDRE